MGYLRSSFDVNDLQEGVCRCFDPNHLGLLFHRRREIFRVGSLDVSETNAEGAHDLIEKAPGPTIEILHRDNVVSFPEKTKDERGYGSHARSESKAMLSLL
jgi:hypothetical protein